VIKRNLNIRAIIYLLFNKKIKQNENIIFQKAIIYNKLKNNLLKLIKKNQKAYIT